MKDCLEAFGSDGFDADEGAFDVGFAHGVEVLAVFAGLHGDLGEEDHVFGELGQFGHEEEAFGADGGELFEFGEVVLFAREAEVGEADRVEVVVGEGDEAEADLAEVDDLVDDGLEGALPGLLAIGAPDTAEGAVLRAAANGLDRSPHVLVASQEGPTSGEEFGAGDTAAIVDFSGAPVRQSVTALAQAMSPSPLTTAWALPCSNASSGKSVAWIPP